MPISQHSNYWLDLGKALDKKKAIDDWVNAMFMAACTTYGKFEAQDLKIVYQATLIGMAKKFYLASKETQRGTTWLENIKDDKSPTTFATPIYEQFSGDISFVGNKARETARTNIYAFKICNMAYFEEYLNKFQDYYCIIGDMENIDLIYLLYKKLPEPWRTAVKESIDVKPL
ncbi:hypothetical protein ACLB2K_001933 [Fragaria x ananassa]